MSVLSPPEKMAAETFGCRPAAEGLLDASEVRAADPASGKQSVYLGLDTRLPDITPERKAEIKAKFPHFPEIYDQQAARREYLVRIPRWVEDWANRHLIADSRDTIMLSTLANMIATTGGLSLLLFCFPSWKLGLCVALFNAGMWVQRFILMMHYSEHKKLFAKNVGFLRFLMPWLMAPFYGIPVGMYRTHHIMMHHKENNMYEKDLSSTEPYQRDSFLGFLHYLGMFYALLCTLPLWAARKGNWSVFGEVCLGCFTWIYVQVYLYQQGHGVYAFWQFQVPFVISSFALMFGNFAQHIFVHEEVATSKDLLSSYRYNCALTVNVFNHFDNQVAFNDGYHITHHVKPTCHWTEMPLEFLTNLERYAEHDPVVFDRCGFFDIGLQLLLRQTFDPEGSWKFLIDRFVHFTPEKRSDEEVKAFLQERLKPIPERLIAKAPK